MLLELLSIAECLVALGAVVGVSQRWEFHHCFSNVDVLMPFQVFHSTESFPTRPALIRPFTRVDALVPLQVAETTKAAAALRAPVGTLARVDQLMALEGPRVREAFAAEFAMVRLLSRLHAFVAFKAPGMAERSPAHRALIRPILGRGTRVLHEVRRGVEAAAAPCAEMQHVSALSS